MQPATDQGIPDADFMAAVFGGVDVKIDAATSAVDELIDAAPKPAPKHHADPQRQAKVAVMVEATKLMNAGKTATEAAAQLIDDGHPRALVDDAIDTTTDQKTGTHNVAGKTSTRQVEAYYYEPKKEYVAKNEGQRWIALNATQMKRRLKRVGLSTKAKKGELVSEADEWMCETEDHYDVKYCGALAGRSEGYYEECGSRILVTSSPRLYTPEHGDPVHIMDYLYGLFNDTEIRTDQVFYFLAWLKIGYECMRNQTYRPGQALVLAGAKDCGKSLLQRIITEVLGGRMAKPYQYMAGATSFNGDLFKGEHLIIEDEKAHTDFGSRSNFGQEIKSFTVNRDQRLHPKFGEGIMMRPLWRLSISLNDEPESLMILPPIDDSISDKMIILRCVSGYMDSITTDDQDAYDQILQRLLDDIPRFCQYLLDFEIPPEMVGRRFGVQAWHHPGIVASIKEQNPEHRLLLLIDDYLMKSCASWQGTSADLKRDLTDIGGICGKDAADLLKSRNATGRYMMRLCKDYPDRFSHKRSSGGAHTIYSIDCHEHSTDGQ